LIWQAPGHLRFDRYDQPGKSLVYNAATDVARGVSLAGEDAGILESLLDDSAESFFYGFQRGVPHRLLGLGFRTDDGKTPGYKGPWLDIYVAAGSTNSQSGKPANPKLYYFDASSGLLMRTQYSEAGGQDVVTEFSWQTVNGQAFPIRIVRKVSGQDVFTFTVTGTAVSAAVNDSAFGQP
jgi:hypothetical protein